MGPPLWADVFTLKTVTQPYDTPHKRTLTAIGRSRAGAHHAHPSQLQPASITMLITALTAVRAPGSPPERAGA